jgi:hypothetical protein
MEPAAMWALQDENSLPTPSERILAREVIDVMQLGKGKKLAKMDQLKEELARHR